MKRAHSLIAAAVLLCVSCTNSNGPKLVYLDENASIEDRVEDALSRMTLEEKVACLHAQSKFSSPGVPRLGIPELWCSDGPHGVRAEVLWDEWNTANWTNDSIVAFPALTCLAATWNKDMAALYGKSIGEEARYREKDVLLGPGVNIFRTPLNGRNFEYMGEDPCLSAKMVVPYVQEVQKNGVATCVKHYALNNQEAYRHEVDVDLDDRALYEIYLPAFKAAVVEGGSWSIMGSYNLFRGTHVCSDKVLLQDILRGEWGFDGAVISDWGGVHETDLTAKYGVDLEYGTWTDGLTMGATNEYDSYYLAKPYLEKLRSGELSEQDLDNKVRNVLRLIFRTAMNPNKPFGAINSEAHYAAARKIGAEGIVLLKNDGSQLPIKSGKKLLVVGENAIRCMTVGGGSSSLKVQRELSPLEGIIERAAKDGIQVEYARGYVGNLFDFFDGVSVGADIYDERSASELIADAVAKAADADFVLFVGGLNKDVHQDCEDTDRYSLELPYGQDAVIEALAAVNSNIAVAIVSGSAVTMPWLEQVPSVLQCWYLGSEAGHALADVVFGDVNPSGKLPFTFPAQLADCPVHREGEAYPSNGKYYYNEGIFVGYRWMEHNGIEPLFAFGHGLSYTSFEIGEAKCRKKADGSVVVKVPVTNTGSVAGAEVVQIYVSDPECSVERPVKELKGFEKVYLEPGECRQISVTLSADAFKFFDAAAHKWVLEAGDFDILVGNSSNNIICTKRIAL